MYFAQGSNVEPFLLVVYFNLLLLVHSHYVYLNLLIILLLSLLFQILNYISVFPSYCAFALLGTISISLYCPRFDTTICSAFDFYFSRDCPIFYMRKKVQKDLAHQDNIVKRFGDFSW